MAASAWVRMLRVREREELATLLLLSLCSRFFSFPLRYTSHLRAIIFLLPIEWLLMPSAQRLGRRSQCEADRVAKPPLLLLRSALSELASAEVRWKWWCLAWWLRSSLYVFNWMHFNNTRVISIMTLPRLMPRLPHYVTLPRLPHCHACHAFKLIPLASFLVVVTADAIILK